MRVFLMMALLATLAMRGAVWAQGWEVVATEDQSLVTQAERDGETILQIKPPARTERGWRAFIRAPDARRPATIRAIGTPPEPRQIGVDALRRGTWTPVLRKAVHSIRLDVDSGVTIPFASWSVEEVDPLTQVQGWHVYPVSEHADRQRLAVIGRGVGMLEKNLLKQDGSITIIRCTAFLVAPDRALTAEHCVQDCLKNRAPTLTLGYLEKDSYDEGHQHGFRILATSPARDLALLEIDPPRPEQDVIAFAAQAPRDEELILLQHIDGAPLSYSADDDCRADELRFAGPLVWDAAGAEIVLPDVAFGHGCDTTKSSSGSPVLNRADLTLVGMHRAGFDASGDTNRAILTDQIRTFLDQVAAGNPTLGRCSEN